MMMTTAGGRSFARDPAILDDNARRREGRAFARVAVALHASVLGMHATHRLRDCMPAHAFGRYYEVTLVRAMWLVSPSLGARLCGVLFAAV